MAPSFIGNTSTQVPACNTKGKERDRPVGFFEDSSPSNGIRRLGTCQSYYSSCNNIEEGQPSSGSLRIPQSAHRRQHLSCAKSSLSRRYSTTCLMLSEKPRTKRHTERGHGCVVHKPFKLRSLDDLSIDPTPQQTEHSNVPNLLSTGELLKFTSKIIHALDGNYDHNNGGPGNSDAQLMDILYDLTIHIEGFSLDEFQRLCLLALSKGLQTRFNEAFTAFGAVHLMSRSETEEQVSAHTLLSLVKLAVWHVGRRQATEFILQNWKYFAPHIWYSNKYPLHAAVQDIIDNASELIELLDSRRLKDSVRMEAGCLFISAFCSKGLRSEAYEVLGYLRKENLEVPSRFKLRLTRSFIKLDALDTAKELFLSIPEATHSFYLGTGLFVFARCGDCDKARKYYDQMQGIGVARRTDATTMILGYSLQGRVEEALDVFNGFFPLRKKRKRKNNPDLLAYSALINAYAERGDLKGVSQWSKELLENGLLPDAPLFGVFAKAFSRKGDVSSIITTISHMVDAGLSPNIMIYTTLITALATQKDPAGAEAIFKHAISNGVKHDRIMTRALMNAHIKARLWKGVIRCFDHLNSFQNLEIEDFNTLLKAYVLIGAPYSTVARLFSRLSPTRVKPDAYTYSLLLQSACNSGEMDAAIDIFMEADILSYNGKWGKLVWEYWLSILMSGYLRMGDPHRAKAVLEEMTLRGVQPFPSAFAAVVKKYADQSNEESLQIAEAFVTSVMSNSQSGPLQSKPVETLSPLEIIYSPLFAAHVKQAKPDAIERLYQDMLDKGGKPSLTALTALMDAYRRVSNIDAVARLWSQILDLGLPHIKLDTSLTEVFGRQTVNGLKSDVLSAALSIYIDAMSVNGRHVEVARAWATVQRHGFVFNSHNWNHIAVALVRAGELERAFEVVENVIIPFETDTYMLHWNRDPKPKTPFLFLEPTPKGGPAEDGSTGNQMIAPQITRRSEESNTASIIEDDFDFARPLEILHRASPSDHTWRPHDATLKSLSRAVRRLRCGRTVMPIKPGGVHENDGALDHNALPKMEATLDMIYKNYPYTIRYLELWEKEERGRIDQHYKAYDR